MEPVRRQIARKLGLAAALVMALQPVSALARGFSIPVPEPGELSLFAIALAVVAWRVHARQLRKD